MDEPQNNEAIMKKGIEEGLPLGNETILVVEDNHEVRKVTGRILTMQGYRVLGASNGGVMCSPFANSIRVQFI